MKLLYINSCVRENSRTNELAQYILKKIPANIEEIKLNDEDIKPLRSETLKKRDLLINNADYNDKMFDYAKQFIKSDIVLVGAPYWDLSFPALLKSYFEMINISGLTFQYVNGKPQTLCKAKKLIYVTTAGGYILNDDFGYGYIKKISEIFYGIKEFEYIKAEGLDIIGNNPDEILNKTKSEIDKINF